MNVTWEATDLTFFEKCADWTMEQRETFLKENSSVIADAMIEAGYDCIQELLEDAEPPEVDVLDDSCQQANETLHQWISRIILDNGLVEGRRILKDMEIASELCPTLNGQVLICENDSWIIPVFFYDGELD